MSLFIHTNIKNGIMLMEKDLTDKTKAWNKIFEALKNNGRDLQT
jgi:hypothetical protein